MKEMLLALKKAVDRAFDAQTATHEIPLAAFPGHAVKSLEHILAEGDAERAAARLTRLQAEVNEACTLVKQGGARIRVVRYEEPERAAKPEVETERDVPQVTKSEAAPDAGLGQALATLGQQVAELRRVLDKAAPAQASDAEAAVPAPGQGDAGQQATAQQAAAQKAAAPEAGAQNADASTGGSPGKADESAAKPEESESATKAQETEPVMKSQAGRAPDGFDWPFDMNLTMPGARAEEVDSELDWGPDPAPERAEG